MAFKTCIPRATQIEPDTFVVLFNKNQEENNKIHKFCFYFNDKMSFNAEK